MAANGKRRVERDASATHDAGRPSRLSAARRRALLAKRWLALAAVVAFGAAMLLARETQAGGTSGAPAGLRPPAQFERALGGDGAAGSSDAGAPVTATRSS